MIVDDGHLPVDSYIAMSASPELFAAQGGGKSLSDAVAQVKRDRNVERIISAKTTTSGGRETHVIKALYKDGKVKTHRIPGRSR